MIQCIIIEDQPPAQRLLQKYITDIGTLNLKGTFSDALVALTFLQQNKVDLIFLDVHLPKLSGMNFLKTITSQPQVILTTAFSEYALESYEYNVIDYLLKPYSFERFIKAVSKVQLPPPNTTSIKENSVDNNTKKELFIKSGHEHIRLLIEDILFIKSDADFTEIYIHNKKHLSYEPLRHWETFLPIAQFYRVHKSYIINVSKIEKIVGNQIQLTDKSKIPIGRVYKEDFMSQITK